MTAYPLDSIITASQGSPGTFANAWAVVLTDLTTSLGTRLNPLSVSGTVSVNTSFDAPTGSSPPQRAALVGGYDTTTGIFNAISVNASGVMATTIDSNRTLLLNNATISSSNSALVNVYGNKEVTMFVNVVGSVTGGGTLLFTLQEVDPGNQSTLVGHSTVKSITTGPTSSIATLPIVNSPYVKAFWTALGNVTGSNVYLTVVSKNANPAVLAIDTGNSNAPMGGRTGETVPPGIIQVGGSAGLSGLLRPLFMSTGGGVLVAGQSGSLNAPVSAYADVNGNFGVAGFTQDGSTRVSSGVIIAGVDSNNLVRTLSTDAQGRLFVTSSDLADGAASPGVASTKSILVGGVYNSTPVSASNGQQSAIQLNQDGGLFVETTTRRSTYSGGIISLTPGANPTDIFVISGSATKTVYVDRVEVSATQTTAGQVAGLCLVKRSQANAGGTLAAVTAVPHDASDGAATAGVWGYTANPATGASVGIVRSAKLFAPAAGTATAGPPIVWDFSTRNSKPIVLRGTGSTLAVNLNAATVTGGSFNISVEWSEE